MSRLKSFDIDPVDVDADGISAAATLGAAGNLTLGGALTSGGTFTSADGAARQIAVTAAADDSGRTFTVTGTDANGNAQTESITGPNAGTTESTKYWNTVTQIAIDDASAGDISVGTVDELASATFPLDASASVPALGHLDVTGTINVTVQVSLQDPEGSYADQEAVAWINSTNLSGKTADTIGALDHGATMARVVVNSYSSGGEVQFYLSQPR